MYFVNSSKHIYIFLESAITALMQYYRKTFPLESITPKLHMLEDHVVDFVKRWGLGLGLYGEQGGESIHPEFNNLKRTYCMMKPNSRRLLAMLKEHHLRVHPEAKSMRPPIKKRKFRSDDDDKENAAS